MKKLFIIILTIITLLSIASCKLPTHTPSSGSSSTATDTQSGGEKPEPEILTAEKALGNISRLLNEKYSKITLTVSVSGGGITDTDQFTMTFGDGVNVAYSIKRANKFTIVDGVVTPPETPYTETQGVVNVKDGVVTLISGEEVSVDFIGITALRLNLAKENFGELTVTETMLKGEVTNPKVLLDNPNLIANSCTIDVSYGTTLKYIKLAYEDNDNQKVQIDYTFVK